MTDQLPPDAVVPRSNGPASETPLVDALSGSEEARLATEQKLAELQAQIDKLAGFIMGIDGEPSRSEGAIDTAIRLLDKHYGPRGGTDAAEQDPTDAPSPGQDAGEQRSDFDDSGL